MLRKRPKPDTKLMVPPKLDHFITDLLHKRWAKQEIQPRQALKVTFFFGANLLANLWGNLSEQGLDGDQWAVIKSQIFWMWSRKVWFFLAM